MGDLLVQRSAVISGDGIYRYRLERQLGWRGWTAAILMVNPSTADGSDDDATIRKLIGFSRHLGIAHLIVGNKFAFRATDVKALRTARDPIGPDNDANLEQIMREADMHIVAWGPMAKLPPKLRTRWKSVVEIANRVGCELKCLGTAQDGHPRHPLMVPYSQPLIPWTAPSLTGEKK